MKFLLKIVDHIDKLLLILTLSIACLFFTTPVLAADVSPSSGLCSELTYSLDDFDNNSAHIYDVNSGFLIADWNGSGVAEPVCPDFDGGTFDLPDGDEFVIVPKQKDFTDEEIRFTARKYLGIRATEITGVCDFARAILRKAQEK